MNETWEKTKELLAKRKAIVERLIAPARAAANQMTDAGMKSGAEPLQQVLFEIDAADAELIAVMEADARAVITGLIDAMVREGRENG